MDQKIPPVALRDGNLMPQLGLGTRQFSADDSQRIVTGAIAAGYRAFDTARDYASEAAIGYAIRDSGMARTEFSVTTRLRAGAQRRDAVLRSFDESMTALDLEQIDLLLLQWPLPEADTLVEAWTILAELQQQGHARSIGVSNFDRVHIEQIIAATGVTPAVNHLELHPYFQQRDVRGFHQRRGIRIASWAPLGPGTPASASWWSEGQPLLANLMTDTAIAALAAKHERSPAQIVLRWHLQEGLLVSPRTVTPARLEENIAIGDFTLDAEDMYRIEAIDRPDQGRMGPDPKHWRPVA